MYICVINNSGETVFHKNMECSRDNLELVTNTFGKTKSDKIDSEKIANMLRGANFWKKLVKGLSKKYWQSQLFLKTIKKSVLKYKYEQRKGDKIVKAALYYWKFSTLRTAPYIQISVFYSRILDKLHFHRVQLRIMGICLFVFLLQIPGLLRLHRLWM